MYQRICKPLLSNSFFLFGSRGTGKSTLLRKTFRKKKTLWIDLLDDETQRKFLLQPGLIEEMAPQKSGLWVVIDEVQRVPALLNHVHRLIENRRLRFALTGSSARKLKRGAANLLAGRAFLNHLHPLTHRELGSDFSLEAALEWGSLPKSLTSKTVAERQAYLTTYASVYLKEEIREEQIVRKIEPFIRFLEVAGQTNGQILNYSKIARDSGNDAKAVERYFEILNDTLVGFFLSPFHRSVRKRQAQKAKFFFFDLGVKRAIEGTLRVPLMKRTYAYGSAFEHFIILECLRLNDYYKKDYRFSYLRTKDDLEVDLIVERPGEKLLLLEIKSTNQVASPEVTRLVHLKKDLGAELWFASQEKHARRVENAEVLPWREVFERLY